MTHGSRTAGRWRPRRAAALLGLLFCAPALGQGSGAETGSVVERFARSVEELSARAQRAIEKAEAEARARPVARGISVLTGFTEGNVPVWTPLKEGVQTPERVVVLIHGLDEPGGIWDDLAGALRDAREDDMGVARFDYPNDGPIAASADMLAASLRDLRERGTTHADLVCHSMGGLVARDVLSRAGAYACEGRGHSDLPDVDRLVMVGTPNAGSPWAKLRALAEIREQVARFLDDPNHDANGLLGFLNDGLGEAGDDLLPGSAFLTDLNAHAPPKGVRVTVIVGRAAPVQSDDLKWIAESWLVRQLLGRDEAAKIAAGIAELSSELGDGVVPVSSAEWAGAADTVYLDANHRSMLRTIDLVRGARSLVGAKNRVPPAIPVILDRLRHEP